MADVKQFKLPDVGEGLTEADIVSWKVKPGDQVTVNQVIVEIETAKSLVELPSPFEGVVTELLVPEGQSVDVGTPIIAVDVSGEAAAEEPGPRDAVPAATAVEDDSAAREPGIHGSPAPKIERQAVLVGYGVKLGTTTRRRRKGSGARGGGGAGRVPAEPVSPAAPSGNGQGRGRGAADG